ncbi:hypothetical protein MAPG_11187 [Magnaporthiopsis poae ATCC 64411]|uniref:Uncharacterized protein n=1 Tax=Magnaporthiopsis poae (strain ATCC 64411 / 73-15) TaxID=644358 RepID=A0A0C4EEL3_MAGP6|nr:hypothetical protein MAPG_11187 [Magnaporthiopsis poae ATCC 64411]
MSNTKMSAGDETPKGRHSKSRSSSRKPTSNTTISNAEKARAEATSPSGMARDATRGQTAPAAEGPRPSGVAGRLHPHNPAPCLQDIIRRQLEKSIGALLLGYSSRGSPPGVLQPDDTAALAGDTSIPPAARRR